MEKRVFSSAVLAVIVLAACMFGATGCLLLIVVAGIFTQMEMYRLLRKIGQKPMVKTGLACGIFLMLMELCTGEKCQSSVPTSAEFLFIVIMAVVIRALLAHSLEMSKGGVVSTIVGIIYVPFMCCFPMALFGEMADSGSYTFTLIWMILVAKSCDIGGMFAGKYYGQRKLAPNFSPRKTVEGFIGGILLSNVVGVILMLLFGRLLPAGLGFVNTVILSTLLAVFALVGDLTESAIKRIADEKDSGRIFPGIGGAFDLTDSLLFSLPVAVIFLKYFIL